MSPLIVTAFYLLVYYFGGFALGCALLVVPALRAERRWLALGLGIQVLAHITVFALASVPWGDPANRELQAWVPLLHVPVNAAAALSYALFGLWAALRRDKAPDAAGRPVRNGPRP